VLRAQIDNALQQDNGHELESRITNAVHAVNSGAVGRERESLEATDS
jgi:hypothetical protein